MRNKYYFTDIVRRLEVYIHCPVGYKGFKILLYGWRVKSGLSIHHFDARDYMTETEVRSFSQYAGYDLTKEP